jgi:hypothetical protein
MNNYQSRNLEGNQQMRSTALKRYLGRTALSSALIMCGHIAASASACAQEIVGCVSRGYDDLGVTSSDQSIARFQTPGRQTDDSAEYQLFVSRLTALIDEHNKDADANNPQLHVTSSVYYKYGGRNNRGRIVYFAAGGMCDRIPKNTPETKCRNNTYEFTAKIGSERLAAIILDNLIHGTSSVLEDCEVRR